jgi:hypothetical protein
MHEQVRHRIFGEGTVIDQAVTIVTVEFCAEYGIKKFLYPSAFESFLELCDPISKEKMDAELQQIRVQAEAVRRLREEERRQEEEKRRAEERRTLLEKKRTAAQKQSSAKTSAKSKKKP